MLKARCRRLTDQIRAGAAHENVTPASRTSASSHGNLLIAGAVKGNSKLSGMLTLLHSGRWIGDVEAANAVVAGQVDGNLTVTGKLEIRSGARIGGTVRADTIAIAEGAVVEGNLSTTSDKPVIRFREKRRKTEPLRPWHSRLRLTARQGVSSLLFRI